MPAKKNPKKADPMLGALAASFGATKPAPSVQKETGKSEPEIQQVRGENAETPAPAPETVIAPPSVAAPPNPPTSAPHVEASSGGGVKKTTVSFHDSEQDKIDLILDALKRSRRHRGGFSDAIKIALRLCSLDEDSIGRAWDEARAQDQRVLRHRRNS